MNFDEPLQINRKTVAPIPQYCEVLNYCSKNYGTPISARMKHEKQLLDHLELEYGRAIQNITKIISKGKVSVTPTATKYNVMHFQNEYLGVNPKLMRVKGTKGISKSAEVRERIDVEDPNFFNSFLLIWAELNSRKKIANVVSFMESIEGARDVMGHPLYVVRPTYSIKEDSTYRITTNNPSLQSLATMHKKEYFVPEEDRIFVGADISSQEPSIFFNGMCYDPRIIELYKETGDLYLSVVSVIENIPPHKVDKNFRTPYKTGILTKMNGGGMGLLAVDMGSAELAKKLIDFINSNPYYAKFVDRVNRQLMTPEPKIGGFIEGWERKVSCREDGAFNKLLNAPLQITAVCFFSISFFAFVQALMSECPEWTDIETLLYDVRPIYHAHDEILLSVSDKLGYPELVSKTLEWALSVKYENWEPFKAKPYISKKYLH